MRVTLMTYLPLRDELHFAALRSHRLEIPLAVRPILAAGRPGCAAPPGKRSRSPSCSNARALLRPLAGRSDR